jgi:hypothetical protein
MCLLALLERISLADLKSHAVFIMHNNEINEDEAVFFTLLRYEICPKHKM